MRRLLLLFILLGSGHLLFSQYVYTIKADSVKITNSCDTAELIIENHTQNVPGFLFNKGKGRTEFKRGLVKINDSLYVIGSDTLNTKLGSKGLLQAHNGASVTDEKVVLGNDVGDTAATLLSDRHIPMNSKSIFLTNEDVITQLTGGDIYMYDSSLNNLTYIRKNVIGVTGNKSGEASSSLFYLIGTFDNELNYADEYVVGSNIITQAIISPHGASSTGHYIHTSYGNSDQFTPSGNGNYQYTMMELFPTFDFSSYSTSSSSFRDVRGILYDPNISGTIPHKHIAIENTTGDNYFNSGDYSFGSGPSKGLSGFQGITTPTAYVHIGAGASAAKSAPLKFTSGTDLTTAEAGAFEFGSSRLAFTPSGTTRKRFAFINDVTPANGQIPIGNGTDYTSGTLTAGAGIAITNASGNITVAAKATLSVSSASTLTLAVTTTDYVFSGSTATWTMPAVAGNTGIRFFIKNRGSGAITLNSNAGSNDLYTSSAVSTLTINPGDAYFLLNDGTYYSVK